MHIRQPAHNADSDEGEGDFYSWSMKEIEELLRSDANLFCAAYGIEKAGNWTNGKNILHRIKSGAELASKFNTTSEDVDIQISCDTKYNGSF